MSNTTIFVLYVDNLLCWKYSQSNINKLLKIFKKVMTSCNQEHTNWEPVYEWLGIEINNLGDREYQFSKTGLVTTVLEATCMNNWDEWPTSTWVELPLRKYDNITEARRDFPSAYPYVIGMMLYLVSNIRLYIYYDVHWCNQFTHNKKA